MKGRRTKKCIQFPASVRTCQKLVRRGGYYLADLVELLGLDWDWDKRQLEAALARLAAKFGPDHLLHKPDGNGGTDFSSPAATTLAVVGSQGTQREGEGAEHHLRPETGIATSGVSADLSRPSNSAHSLAPSPSTALGESGVAVDQTGKSAAPPRDAGGAGTQAPRYPEDVTADAEASNNLGEAFSAPNRPRKKWGKALRAGRDNRQSWAPFGGVYADLAKVGVGPSLLNLARQRLAALVSDSSQETGPRLDPQQFSVRLLTYQQPSRARKEEDSRPILWVLADVSGSCSAFAWPSLQVAKACSRLGVPGSDVIAIAHSNGYPTQAECNGRLLPVKDERDHFWLELARRYPPRVVIALGDWDAVDVYQKLALLPIVQRFIWLDNYCCSRGPRDRTSWALQRLNPKLKFKLRYVDGCRDAKDFLSCVSP